MKRGLDWVYDVKGLEFLAVELGQGGGRQEHYQLNVHVLINKQEAKNTLGLAGVF